MTCVGKRHCKQLNPRSFVSARLEGPMRASIGCPQNCCILTDCDSVNCVRKRDCVKGISLGKRPLPEPVGSARRYFWRRFYLGRPRGGCFTPESNRIYIATASPSIRSRGEERCHNAPCKKYNSNQKAEV